MDDPMKWGWALALVACQGAKSAERQEEFAQALETRRDEGAWTREVWEYGSPQETKAETPAGGLPDVQTAQRRAPQAGTPGQRPPEVAAGGLTRHTFETHAPVVTVSESKTQAATEGHSASSYRFGWSPWTIAIGLLALAAGAYGLWRLKARLGV